MPGPFDVAVVGSLHLDIMVAAPRLPGRDETLMGSSWHRKCGGKGGNQALAAARAGAKVGFGGAVGLDEFGIVLRDNLLSAGVDVSYLETDGTRGSGMSVAIEEEGGEYGAVVVSGANRGIEAFGLAERWGSLWEARVLLLQNEVPEEVNLAAARAAKAGGARLVLNAAPARVSSPDLLDLVDLLVVNRVEARQLTGSEGEAALRELHAPGRDVVLTLGAEGLRLLTREDGLVAVPPTPVRALSSHGAGDSFCGTLGARLAAGDGLETACRTASRAAARFVAGM
jgi:ribokinase